MNTENAFLRTLATLAWLVGMALFVGSFSSTSGVAGLGIVLIVTGILGTIVASLSLNKGNMMHATEEKNWRPASRAEQAA